MAPTGTSELTDEQLMEMVKEKVIRLHTHTLVQRLEPKTHLPFFVSKFVLSVDECDDIKTRLTRAQRADRFIELLMTKGQKGFDCLIESLINDKTQIELAKAMNISFEEERNKAFTRKVTESPKEDEDCENEHLPGPSPVSVTGARYSTTFC